MGKVKNMTGEIFPRLFVIRREGLDKHGNATWRCRCSCGNEIIVPGNSLRSRNTTSCGHCPTIRYEKHVDYMVGYLPTGQHFLFDKIDFSLVAGHRWVFDNGYVRTSRSEPIRYFLHNIICCAGCGEEGQYVDHINQNKLDNRRQNLRLATKSQNGMNRALQSNNTTGYKGVSYLTKNKKYRARIKINSCEKHLGLFSTPELAAIAYDLAALQFYGEYAHTNIIQKENYQ